MRPFYALWQFRIIFSRFIYILCNELLMADIASHRKGLITENAMLGLASQEEQEEEKRMYPVSRRNGVPTNAKASTNQIPADNLHRQLASLSLQITIPLTTDNR
jgi:hypothetical protein